MLSPSSSDPPTLHAPDPRHRVLALRDLAVAQLGVRSAVEWLFAPCAALLGVEPAPAAWYSPRVAVAAARVLPASHNTIVHTLLVLHDLECSEFTVPEVNSTVLRGFLGGPYIMPWRFDGPDGCIVAYTPADPSHAESAVALRRERPVAQVSWAPRFGSGDSQLFGAVVLAGFVRDGLARSLSAREILAIRRGEPELGPTGIVVPISWDLNIGRMPMAFPPEG